MYEQYWELKQAPFVSNSDPAFFFRSASHKAALLKLRYLLEHLSGAGLLVGGTGYGKSYLVSVLAQELKETVGPVIHLVYPQMSPPEFLAYLAMELGADETELNPADGSLDRIIRQIERRLEIFARKSQHPLILIDEAHLIEDPRLFQTVQLLLNFQQRETLRFSVILVGERTLIAQVQRIAQLESRVAVKALLQPFSLKETSEYVAHRLRVAGRQKPIFDEAAVQTLFELSGGVPQRINRLADLSLLIGLADRLPGIAERQVEAAAEELTLMLPD